MSHYEYDKPLRIVDDRAECCDLKAKIKRLEIINTKLKLFLTIQTTCTILALMLIV